MSEDKLLKEVLERDGYGECWICGHNTYEGPEKLHGFQEEPDGTLELICSVCLQVQLIANREGLHEDGCNGSPFVRMFMVRPSDGSKPRKVIGYRVLDREPWIEKFGELVEGGALQK